MDHRNHKHEGEAKFSELVNFDSAAKRSELSRFPKNRPSS
jgi:hypothetical protein